MTDTGLDLGLADPRRAGVYFITADDIGPLDAACRDAGLLCRRVDLRGCEGKPALLLRMALALDAPGTGGRNWDALGDRLRDLSWLPAPGYALLFQDAQALRDADEPSFDILLDLLDEAARAWAARDVPFWAFLSLPDAEFEDASG